MVKKIGILLTNLGTPDAPTPHALRQYLRAFLGDERVIEFKPRWVWHLILNGLILPFRARKSARLYRSIWTDNGSPLLKLSQDLTASLSIALKEQGKPIPVVLGMRYGKPSLKDAMLQLRKAHIEQMVVLPLYPQFSATTTATTFDQLAKELKPCRHLPEMVFINDYYQHPAYIKALAQSVQSFWQQESKAEVLVMSFHGLPKEYVDKGDPYQKQCLQTAQLLAQALNLQAGEWQVSFQSRFGPREWLKPYTDQAVKSLAEKGHRHIQVICPGFAVDCLETLEEIAEQIKESFIHAGGKQFEYIPCLNDSPEHVQMLVEVLGAYGIR